MKRSIFRLFVVLTLCFFANTLEAQGLPNNEDVILNLIPASPGWGEIVDASVSTYAFNLDFATITWSLNGKVIKSGTGEKSINFTMPQTGSGTTLSVSVKAPTGESAQISKTIVPTSIDMIWQSESFTPPFYKGKAEYTLQSKVSVIAIPHIPGSNGAEVSPKNIAYKWKKNGSVIEKASGFGKNVLTLDANELPRAMDITVEATTLTNVTTYGTVRLNPTEPSVLFYEKNPLYGIIFQKALQGDIEMNTSPEINVVAMPMFFGTKDPYQGLTYTWRVNGKEVDNDTSQMIRVFRYATGTSGKSNVSISIGHKLKSFQLAKSGFSLTFGVPNTGTDQFSNI